MMFKRIFFAALFIAFSFLSLKADAACPGGVCYVRTDGGTSTQCNGGSDASVASAPNCAFNHPAWALGATGTIGIMTGGDDLIIGPGSYMIGYGMPNTVGCAATARQNCVLNTPPSGTVSNPTRILGKEWNTGCSTRPELWGTEGNRYMFTLTGTSNVEMQCLEITDHSNCGQRTGVLCTDWNTNGPLGTWSAFGLFGYNIANLKLWNMDIHGLAGMGVNFGGLTGVTDIKNTNIVGNYFAGFDGDTTPRGGPVALLYGTLRMHNTKIKWSGCQEAYPRTGTKDNILSADYANCTGNENGGYGEGFSGGSSSDGVGTNGSSGLVFITNSDISNNTSDGIDFLYASNNLDFYMDKTITEGNAGNQLKITGKNVEVTNTFIGGNCSVFSKAGKTYPTPPWGSSCRSGGVPIALTPVLGSAFKFRNITHFGADDSDGSAILEISNRNGTCNGTETYDFKNMIAYNQVPGFWQSGNGFYNVNLSGSCLTAFNNRTVTYSNIYQWGTHPGTGNTYTAPSWVSAINNNIPSNISNLLLSSNVGGGNASTYWNTSTDLNNFPQNASIDQGSFQFGTDASYRLAGPGQACTATVDCASGTCTNFVCSGSCTANGGACATGASCCSAYCNASVCANPPTCGDAIVQPGEVCDGSNLNGSNCTLQGFTGGSLACASNCSSFDTSGCTSTNTFPLSPILDNFNRANQGPPPSSNWTTVDRGMEVSSNQMIMSATGTGNWYSQWSGSSFGADVEAYGKIVTKPADGSSVVFNIRADLINDNAYYLLFEPLAGTDRISLGRRVADVETTLGTPVNQEVANGDSIGISVVGSNVKSYHKPSAGSWTQKQSATDTSVTAAGFHTIYTDGSALVIDDFGGGSVNPVVCGNGLKEGSEVCDGADLGGQSCVDRGFTGGSLACASNCLTYDTSGCTTASTCGNNTKESGEICDGTDLDSQTCTTQGYASGSLSCASNCTSFVTTGCVSGGSGVRGGIVIK